MREKWTDERLDDLNDSVRELRAEVRELRGEMNARFDALQRTMLQVGGGMIVTLAATLVTVLATNL